MAERKPTLKALSLRATSIWETWLNDCCRRTCRSRASLIEHALAEYARANGMPPPPPRVSEIAHTGTTTPAVDWR
jgi:hypothetical protein